MKKQLQLLILTSVCLLGVNAWAAEPTLTWTAEPGETLDAFKQKLADLGTVTMGAGITIDNTTGEVVFGNAPQGGITIVPASTETLRTIAMEIVYTLDATTADYPNALLTMSLGTEDIGLQQASDALYLSYDSTTIRKTYTGKSPPTSKEVMLLSYDSRAANGTGDLKATRRGTYAFIDGTAASTLTDTGLVWGSDNYKVDRMSFGVWYADDTMANAYEGLRISSIKVWKGSVPTNEEIVASAEEAFSAGVFTREVSGTTGTWAEDKPAADFYDVTLNVTDDAALEMDANAILNLLTVNGADASTALRLTPSATTPGTLSARTTTINANTDVSRIESDLGAVTVASEKTLKIGANSSMTLADNANSGTITIASGSTESAPATIHATDKLKTIKLEKNACLVFDRGTRTGNLQNTSLSGADAQGSSIVVFNGISCNWGLSQSTTPFSNVTMKFKKGNVWLRPLNMGENVHLDLGSDITSQYSGGSGEMKLASLSGSGTFKFTSGTANSLCLALQKSSEFSGTFSDTNSGITVKAAEGVAETPTFTTSFNIPTLNVLTVGEGTRAVNVVLSNVTTTEATHTVTVNENATLTLNTPEDATLANAFAGVGTISKTGSGALTLTDIAGFNGKVDLAVGALVATSAELNVTTTVEGMEVKKVTDDESVTTYTLGEPTPDLPEVSFEAETTTVTLATATTETEAAEFLAQVEFVEGVPVFDYFKADYMPITGEGGAATGYTATLTLDPDKVSAALTEDATAFTLDDDAETAGAKSIRMTVADAQKGLWYGYAASGTFDGLKADTAIQKKTFQTVDKDGQLTLESFTYTPGEGVTGGFFKVVVLPYNPDDTVSDATPDTTL